MDGVAWHGGTPGGPNQALAVRVVAKWAWHVGSEITVELAPLCPCSPQFLLAYSFLKKVHINTLTNTHMYAHAQTHSTGLSP